MTGTEDQRRDRWLPAGRTLLSALAIAAALPPWDLWPLSFVALVPWLDELGRARSLGSALVQGFWLALVTVLLAASWMAVAFHEFLGVSWAWAVLGLVAFAALAQPQLVLFAPLGRWARGRTAFSVVPCAGLAAAYTGFDVLLPRPLDVGLGYGLHAAGNLRQLADLGGVPLLTFLVVWINLLVFGAIESWRDAGGRPRAALAHAVMAASLLGAACIYGELRNRELRAALEAPPRTLHASLVQGNVANEVRLAWAAGDDRAAERQLSAYTRPTEAILARSERPDFVVWPEATYPGAFGKAVGRAQRGRSVKFDRMVLRLGVPLVFGAYDAVEGEEGVTLYNGLFLVNPDYDKPGSLGFVQRYHKHALLPFAETVPGLSEDSVLRRLLPTLGFFGRGDGPRVLRLAPRDGAPIQVGPVICSEALHARHVAEGARRGSQLILNVGSDGWFGRSGEPEFHLAIAKLRSVETRLPQVRAANTGISALILPSGEVAARSELGTSEVLDVEIPIGALADRRPTLFTRGGFAFGPMAGLLGLGFTAFLATRDRRAHGEG